MISTYLSDQIKLADEHSARLNQRIQSWRQMKEKLNERENEIVNADMPIVAPRDIKPRQRDHKLIRGMEEEKNAIAAQLKEARNAHCAMMCKSKQKIEQLSQKEAQLDQQIEADNAYFDAQLEKLDAELAFVSSLLAQSQ